MVVAVVGVVVVLVVVCGLWFVFWGLGFLVCGSWFVVNGLGLYGPILGLCWPILAHLGAMLAHLGPILGLGWPILRLCWPILRPMLAHVDPSSATNSEKWEKMGTAKNTVKRRGFGGRRRPLSPSERRELPYGNATASSGPRGPLAGI